MRAREKRVIVAASAVTIVLLVVTAYFVVYPSGTLFFRAHDFGEVSYGDSYLGVEVEICGWAPVGLWGHLLGGGLPRVRAVEQSYWTIDKGDGFVKYSTIKVTYKIKITYAKVKPYSVNVTVLAAWLEESNTGDKSYIINSSQTSINGANTDGVWDHYSSNPFTGSKSPDEAAADMSLPTDSTVTVYHKYQYKVVAYSQYTDASGDYILLTVDPGVKDMSPASSSWQYVTSETSTSSEDVSVTFSSWLDMFDVGLGVALVALVAFMAGRRLKR